MFVARMTELLSLQKDNDSHAPEITILINLTRNLSPLNRPIRISTNDRAVIPPECSIRVRLSLKASHSWLVREKREERYATHYTGRWCRVIVGLEDNMEDISRRQSNRGKFLTVEIFFWKLQEGSKFYDS